MQKKKDSGSKWWTRWRELSPIRKAGVLVISMVLVGLVVSRMQPTFEEPTSTIVYASDGQLIGAKIAADGQWRFPYRQEVPDKFAQALVLYEDEYFYWHFGCNPVSICKAWQANREAGKVIRGGSTLTQQTIRLSRQNPSRTYFEKIKELFLSVGLELGASKKKILSYYASYAPFGGNVVGLDAAAWRYFKSDADQLSWAEAGYSGYSHRH